MSYATRATHSLRSLADAAPRYGAALCVALLLVGLQSAQAQGRFDDVQIKTTQVTDSIYMLEGAGGNLGVLKGPDGVLLVDDQFAPLSEKIQKAIAEISDGSIRFVVNTHWHGDHTGGNENMAKAGAVVMAHQNVRDRMNGTIKREGREDEPSPAAALPLVTYREGVTFNMNGQTVQAFHMKNAHTDGDTVLFFEDANVVHMGDTFFNGMYPFIDDSSGGHIDGVIAVCTKVLALADGATQIIPGHGPLTDKAGLKQYRSMLIGVRDAVETAIDAGLTADATVESKPTTPWDEVWDGGFISAERMTRAVYQQLSNSK